MSITLYCTLGIQFYERRVNEYFLGNDKIRPGFLRRTRILPPSVLLLLLLFYQVKIGGLCALMFHPGKGWTVATHEDPRARKEKALNIKG